jgi:uncharacterized protein YkwD
MLTFVLFLLTWTVLIGLSVVDAIVLADFQQQALNEHNYYRQLDCTIPMILNSSINTIAQTYATYLATNNLFAHSGTAGLGENLYFQGGGNANTFINGK